MRTVTSATFRDTFTEMKEPVQVRRYTTVLGTWFPAGTREVTMDETVKKAIEKDQVKVRPGRPGKADELSKGLGDVPGFGEFRPAPKPSSKK